MPVWERQPEETDQAYAAFQSYLWSLERKVADHGASAYAWSSDWQWGFRAYEWDKDQIQVDLQDQVRFRRQMFDRQRRMARAAQALVEGWFEQTDPSKWTPKDAARFWDLAVRIERTANGGVVSADGVPGSPPLEEKLHEIFQLPPEMEAQLARLLHEGAPRVREAAADV